VRYAEPIFSSEGTYTIISGIRMTAPPDPNMPLGGIKAACCEKVAGFTFAPFQDQYNDHYYTWVNDKGFVEECDCGALYPIPVNFPRATGMIFPCNR
jgi:hypothetical protein